jgi:hypothetical protein
VSIYADLTREFNARGLVAVLSSGQAVVLHRLAIMSKDGDWILRETEEATSRVLEVLGRHGARYRLGAPLDVRWLSGGWSSHFEFAEDGLRVRTDFVTRPPRLSPEDLQGLWREQAGADLPFVDARRLIELKKTNREKDYAVIGELARLLVAPREQLLASRSARDLEALARAHPALVRELAAKRPLLAESARGAAALEPALDAERRRLIHENERRLERHLEAARVWAAAWPALRTEVAGLPLFEAHRRIVERAMGALPFRPEGWVEE